jgi:hypothetical protein
MRIVKSPPAIPHLRTLRQYASGRGLPFTRWPEIKKVAARYELEQSLKN